MTVVERIVMAIVIIVLAFVLMTIMLWYRGTGL
jgi:hypothetical protein